MYCNVHRAVRISLPSFLDWKMLLMEHVLTKCCMVYIDDAVVYSGSMLEHLQHVHQVFTCRHKARLTRNLKKCYFIQRSLAFISHIVSGDGVKTDPSKVSAVKSFPIQSIKYVQRFLGLAGWYHINSPLFKESCTTKKKKCNLDLDRTMSTCVWHC